MRIQIALLVRACLRVFTQTCYQPHTYYAITYTCLFVSIYTNLLHTYVLCWTYTHSLTYTCLFASIYTNLLHTYVLCWMYTHSLTYTCLFASIYTNLLLDTYMRMHFSTSFFHAQVSYFYAHISYFSCSDIIYIYIKTNTHVWVNM